MSNFSDPKLNTPAQYLVALSFIALSLFQHDIAFPKEIETLSHSLTPAQIQQGKKFLEQEKKIETPPLPKATGASEDTFHFPEPLPLLPEDPLSPFEAMLRGKDLTSISMEIDQFGYDLFEQPPMRFESVDLVPVGPDYLLGPGDEILLSIWGKVNASHRATLDREGKVFLPQMGVLHLSGMTFAEAKTFLKKELSRYFKRSEVNMNVSMGSLRSIRVFVVGKARRPGSYTLSSLSTLINALFASGGPGKTGTMRNIQVKRKGETIVHFDLYDFLLHGEKGDDIRLMPEDVIFIPTVGPLVGIAGIVKSPAIYEMKGNTSLQDLIKMAGGISASAYLQQVQIERVFENKSKIILDLDLKSKSRPKEKTSKSNFLLKDGDVVKVFSVDAKVTNSVFLKGNVVRPGQYAWKEGMRIRDLIGNIEDLLPESLLKFALIERIAAPDHHKEYLSIALGRLLLENDESQNIVLQPDDTIVVFNRWDLAERKTVSLFGAVNRPGNYEYRQNMKLSDLFTLSGGMERPEHPESYLPEGMIIRKIPPDFHEEKIPFNLIKAILLQDENADLLLEPLDEVRIFDKWDFSQKKEIHITGAVNHPGTYRWAQNMRIKDLINIAGGTKNYTFLEEAELTRISPTPIGPKIARKTINLRKAIAGDLQSNILLHEDDYLSVQTVPEWERYRTVKIEGEVRFPGTYTSKKGERLSSLIERAGGFTENAFLKGSVFTRESVQTLQQMRINQSIDRLEQQLLSQSATTIEAALTPEAVAQHQASIGQRKALLAKLRTAKAIGRVAITLDQLESFADTQSDLVLEEGDHLSIPERPQQVQVIGAVYNQNAFIYDQKATVSQYLKISGGMTQDADPKALYVLKVDGTAISRKMMRRFWGNGLMSLRLDPGDTIVVPESIEKIAWLREVKDFTQILYQMAVTAGVLIVAF
ncbi:MAG: SLBB domain-containing protein [Nitrospiria bacterium]